MGKRPTGILAICGYFGLKIILAVVLLGIIHSMLSGVPSYAMASIAWIVGVIDALFIVLIAIHVFLIWLLYTGKKWGRYAVIGLTIYSLVNSILNVTSYGAMAGALAIGAFMTTVFGFFIIVDVFVIYYMFRPSTKAYFNQETSGSSSAI